VFDYDEFARVTWARIPHFYSSPYYVYQYATCFASTAHLVKAILGPPSEAGRAAVARYLDLLGAGGSDLPMNLLQRAGVDLRDPATVRDVVEQLDVMVTRLEGELRQLGLSG
jgi:oligoendopeptidase F